MVSAAEVYNPETDHWTPISRMISPRSGLKVAVYNNFLYAIGGFDGSIRLQTGKSRNLSIYNILFI